MKHGRVKQVVAYVFENDQGEVQRVARSVFWPGCATTVVDGQSWAQVDWDTAPYWERITTDSEQPLPPVRELLSCGHELPMRRWRKGWYVRPGRVCSMCAAGFEPSTIEPIESGRQ